MTFNDGSFNGGGVIKPEKEKDEMPKGALIIAQAMFIIAITLVGLFVIGLLARLCWWILWGVWT